VLLGYLVLFPPILVLGPLAALLAASRPDSPREWIWLAVTVGGIAFFAAQASGIASTMLIGWGLMAAGAFALLMLTGDRPLMTGALGAAGLATAGATGWAWILGTRWKDVTLAVAHDGWERCRELLDSGLFSPERAAGVRVYINAMADGIGASAVLFPGLLIASALPGMALAWGWYHRIAVKPYGHPAGPFAEFRFSDDVIWGVVLCLALLVLPLPNAARVLGANLALIVGCLYVTRGAAIVWSVVSSSASGVLVALCLGAFFIFPVALSGLFLFGLSDTWIDFRRRFTPAASGG
jgi:hypothetical protein